jgi:hypothetical protein
VPREGFLGRRPRQVLRWKRRARWVSPVVAGLLAERQRPLAGTTRWLIRQGFDMGRPSLIEL